MTETIDRDGEFCAHFGGCEIPYGVDGGWCFFNATVRGGRGQAAWVALSRSGRRPGARLLGRPNSHRSSRGRLVRPCTRFRLANVVRFRQRRDPSPYRLPRPAHRGEPSLQAREVSTQEAVDLARVPSCRQVALNPALIPHVV